jgi:hypothetical protein
MIVERKSPIVNSGGMRMKASRALGVVVALLWLGMGLAAAARPSASVVALAPAPEPTTTEEEEALCVGVNLLTNPSFEGPYSSYDPPPNFPDCPFGICTTAQMAAGWTPYWRSHNPADPEWIMRMPEYKPAELWHVNPDRVRHGSRAQQLFTFWGTHEAGFYQRVAVQPGASYCFSIWGHSWSTMDDETYSGPETGQLVQKIGIDPTGGTNWQSSAIVWSGEREQYDVYGLFEVEAVAQASAVTVFVYSQPSWAVKHNDVYWDDARLTPPMKRFYIPYAPQP